MKLPGYEARVVEALREHGLAERTLISTMEPESLVTIREVAPDIRLGRSFPRVRRDYTKHPIYRWPAYGLIVYWRRRLPAAIAAQLRAGEIDALMAHWAFVTPQLCEAVLGAGGEIYVWTVDVATQYRQARGARRDRRHHERPEALRPVSTVPRSTAPRRNRLGRAGHGDRSPAPSAGG